MTRGEPDESAMPVLDLTALPAALAAKTPVVGLDHGEKTIGVAVSDVGLVIASPLAGWGMYSFSGMKEVRLRLFSMRKSVFLLARLP